MTEHSALNTSPTPSTTATGEDACIACGMVARKEIRMNDYLKAIDAFLNAFDKRYEGETDRKRSNGVSPNMEAAIQAMRELRDNQQPCAECGFGPGAHLAHCSKRT